MAGIVSRVLVVNGTAVVMDHVTHWRSAGGQQVIVHFVGGGELSFTAGSEGEVETLKAALLATLEGKSLDG